MPDIQKIWEAIIAKARRGFTLIAHVVVVALAICLLSFGITWAVTGVPTVFGIRPYLIMSESMEPVIHKGQFVIAKPVRAEELEPGDIAAYIRSGNAAVGYTVIHRVMEIYGDEIIFKGDHNAEADEAVNFRDVKYSVIFY